VDVEVIWLPDGTRIWRVLDVPENILEFIDDDPPDVMVNVVELKLVPYWTPIGRVARVRWRNIVYLSRWSP
jgi:hypothetical protein